MQAGLTYICEDDISQILTEKCIDVEFQGEDRVRDKRICGRKLIDFLYGYPIETGDEPSQLTVTTGNDLPMLTP